MFTLATAQYKWDAFPSFVLDKQNRRCIRCGYRSFRNRRVIQVAQLGFTLTLRVADVLAQNHVFQQYRWNELEHFHLYFTNTETQHGFVLSL